jgi:hypothetical protein
VFISLKIVEKRLCTVELAVNRESVRLFKNFLQLTKVVAVVVVVIATADLLEAEVAMNRHVGVLQQAVKALWQGHAHVELNYFGFKELFKNAYSFFSLLYFSQNTLCGQQIAINAMFLSK